MALSEWTLACPFFGFNPHVSDSWKRRSFLPPPPRSLDFFSRAPFSTSRRRFSPPVYAFFPPGSFGFLERGPPFPKSPVVDLSFCSFFLSRLARSPSSFVNFNPCLFHQRWRNPLFSMWKSLFSAERNLFSPPQQPLPFFVPPGLGFFFPLHDSFFLRPASGLPRAKCRITFHPRSC